MRRREFIALVGGAAVAWPLPLRTQQLAMPVIGFLSIASPQVDVVRLAAFRQALKESGYIEGHNVAIEYRAAEDQPERLPALATDLVRHPVSVIVVVGPARSRRRGDRVRPREFIAGFGGAAASVLAAHAQQTNQKAWRIGYLSEATRAPDETFRQSLRKLGYTEGSNLTTSEILVSKQKFA